MSEDTTRLPAVFVLGWRESVLRTLLQRAVALQENVTRTGWGLIEHPWLFRIAFTSLHDTARRWAAGSVLLAWSEDSRTSGNVVLSSSAVAVYAYVLVRRCVELWRSSHLYTGQDSLFDTLRDASTRTGAALIVGGGIVRLLAGVAFGDLTIYTTVGVVSFVIGTLAVFRVYSENPDGLIGVLRRCLQWLVAPPVPDDTDVRSSNDTK